MALPSIPFWERLADFGDRTALVEPSRNRLWTYGKLADAIASIRAEFPAKPKKLAVLFAPNRAETIICYLGLVAAGHAVLLANPGLSASGRSTLISELVPDLLLYPEEQDADIPNGYCRGNIVCGYRAASGPGREPPHPDLALVLSTSGSTGQMKLVRLSKRNLAVAAAQSRIALQLGNDSRAIVNLPIWFMYALSIIHSHLDAGATLVIEPRSILQRDFWTTLRELEVTHFSGVPWTYRTMKEIGVRYGDLTTIRQFTQSGGTLDPAVLNWLLEICSRSGAGLYTMYGITEACGRAAILSASEVHRHPSVGRPVPGGTITCSEDGEVIYRGPNVMLGYATTRADLSRGDDTGQVLFTGDIGSMDAAGYVYLNGRRKRLSKIMGTRIDLDSLERAFHKFGPAAAIGDDHAISVFVESTLSGDLATYAAKLAQELQIPAHAIHLKAVAALPRAETGKVLYSALAQA